jgi:hypothetical protein
MPQLRRSRQIELDDAGAAASTPDVQLQRVVPAVSIGMVRPHVLEPDATDDARSIDLQALWAALRTPVVRNSLLVVGLMAVLAVAVGDVRAGVGGALLVGAVVSIRFFDRHVAFSFGEGFVGFRGEPGWPRGVQEDYEVRWDVRPRTVSQAAEHRT